MLVRSAVSQDGKQDEENKMNASSKTKHGDVQKVTKQENISTECLSQRTAKERGDTHKQRRLPFRFCLG